MAQPILSQSTVSTDGKWEGWCWYPDQPLERAVVEVFVGNRSIRAVRAARLRTDIRDLGMGDGYCGFQLPLPLKPPHSGQSIVEVRERRFGRVLGRVVVGDDGALEAKSVRLNAAATVLRKADGSLNRLNVRLRQRAAPLEELGAILAYRSLQPGTAPAEASSSGTWAVSHDRIAALRPVDLGWCENPRLTLVVWVTTSGGHTRDVRGLCAGLNSVAFALRGIGAEIILLHDGEQASTDLLPGRLRGLRVIRSVTGSSLGVGLNAAAVTARGTWLAFARSSALGIAELREVVEGAADGTCHIETSAGDAPASARHHRLQALVARQAFKEMGGFDTQLEGPALWADLSDRAALIGQSIVKWMPVRDIALIPAAGGGQDDE